MMIKERSWSSSSYRFGFNGKEQDNEVSGQGNSYNYGFRIYNPRIARFLSVDPLATQYPFYSPYQYSSNNPVFSVDIDGLEASKILNVSESLLHTPYEYGGKNPHPDIIGYLNTEVGRNEWVNKLKPALKNIANNHPNLSSASWSDYSKAKSAAYKQFSKYAEGKHNLGIDCSGFVAQSYLADKTLELNPSDLNTSSRGQLNVFKRAEKSGKAYVHQDFSLVSKGDFIFKPGHVMIATGNVKKDENGKVTYFETMEAHNTEKGSIKMWRSASSKYTIGHPFRNYEMNSTAVATPDGPGDSQKLSNKERTELYLDQETVENSINPFVFLLLLLSFITSCIRGGKEEKSEKSSFNKKEDNIVQTKVLVKSENIDSLSLYKDLLSSNLFNPSSNFNIESIYGQDLIKIKESNSTCENSYIITLNNKSITNCFLVSNICDDELSRSRYRTINLDSITQTRIYINENIEEIKDAELDSAGWLVGYQSRDMVDVLNSSSKYIIKIEDLVNVDTTWPSIIDIVTLDK